VQRLGHVEVDEVAGQDVAWTVLRQQLAVEEHPDRLDRVERNALGAVEDAASDLVGQAGDQALERLAHRVVGQRREGDVRAPGWALGGDLRPGERQDEDRVLGRPLDEVVDEVQQPRVGPLDVLEDHHHGSGGRDALEEQPPAREQVGPVRGDPLLQAEEMREPRLDQPPLALVGHVALDGLVQPGARGAGVLLLEDARTRAHHLGERPVADALAVGQAAALVPAEDLLQAVDVLEVLPQQARLARARVADDRDEARRALRDARLPGRDDVVQLLVAADERRLQPGAAARSAHAGHHAQRRPGADGLVAALDLVAARVLVGDRRLGGAPRHVVDEHHAGRRDALQT
jgi:hypothetical protein